MAKNKNEERQAAKEAKALEPALRALSESVGDFIRYWGFRRIHGQIWTQLYVSTTPLSGANLVTRLGVSKALVSPALAELEEYGLIVRVGGDRRTKMFGANSDVFGVIKNILRNREKKLIDQSLKTFEVLAQMANSQTSTQLNGERVLQLKNMILAAEAAIDLTIQLSSEETLSGWSDREVITDEK